MNPMKLHMICPGKGFTKLNGVMFRKESLKAGVWHGNTPNGKPYVVTLDRLREIAAETNRAIQNGIRIPLVWTHSDDPRNRLGDVTGVDIVGDSLYTSIAIPNPSDAEKASLSDVSVEVTPNYTDGHGNRYSEVLTHLAVVTNPAVPELGPWESITLSLREPQKMRRYATRMVKGKFLSRQLAEGESGSAGELVTDSLPEGAEEVASLDPVPEETASKIIEVINKWALADGYKPLPDGTNGENLVANLSIWAMYNLEESESESEPISDDTPAEVLDSSEPVEMGKKKAKELVQLRARVDELSSQLSAQRRSVFEARANALVDSGRLTVVAKNKMVQLAAKGDYDPSILDAIADEPAVGSGSQASRVLTQLAAKTTEKSYSDMTAEERKAYRSKAFSS